MDRKNYLLKKATLEDYDFIYGVKKRTLRSHIEKIWGWDEEYQKKDFSENFIPSRNNIILVNDINIGVLEVAEEDKIIHITELEILPEFQGKGIGSEVIKDILKDGKEKGKKVKIGCFKINEGAKSLYLRLGFKILDETETHFIFES
ncbi:Acetyltransferase (GNAT) family protein [Proteiniborus ethanoligenes]|uniref:Acetyltransferase (GNAT) family protein n=1 Tax=Proteiniborus ethanoligenes TaxID=415015 RepID=A0A1H3K3S4_9FIRM|nr:GNAT family N-acetyltransferase [Proteiniborus ethanoligenes]SDY46836.1 Acetyltransferase (GNAT) family protein [Proteiniborus ethanoligenes]